MNDRPTNPLAAWAATAEGQAVLHDHALRNIERIRAMPRCGAKAKSTGQPCKQPGSGRGGRCPYHGGKSTAGETWGVRQWSDSPSPVVVRRQLAKAKWVERAETEREERISAMSPDERARYEKWLADHAPGSQDQRVGAKLRAAFRGTEAQNVSEMSIEEIMARLTVLRAERRAWEAYRALEERPGVFE